MSRYRILVKVEPGIRLRNPGLVASFDFPNQKGGPHIIMKTGGPVINGQIVQTRLLFSVEVTSDTIHEGIALATGQVLFITSVYSMTSGNPLASVYPLVAYDVSADIDSRDFFQYVYSRDIEWPRVDGNELRQDMLSRGLFEIESIGQMLKCFDQVRAEHLNRVLRSMRWYRLGLEQESPLERFVYFWTALENLEPILFEKLNLNDRMRPCPKCSTTAGFICASCGTKVDFDVASNGMKTYLGDREFRECSRIRNDTLHGNVPIAELTTRAKSKIRAFQQTVFLAILFSLGLDDVKKVAFPGTVTELETLLTLETKLENFVVPDQLELEKDPRFSVKATLKSIRSDAGALYTEFSFGATLQAHQGAVSRGMKYTSLIASDDVTSVNLKAMD